MKNLIHISKAQDLPPILDLIHDNRFEKDRIRFSREATRLEIDFYREDWESRKAINKYLFIKRVLVPVLRFTLIISHVENYQIVGDREDGPGEDDFFNVLTFDKEKNQIWISTIIAKGISVKVRDFEISIQQTDEVVKEKTRLSVFS